MLHFTICDVLLVMVIVGLAVGGGWIGGSLIGHEARL
jgi:hypothetical protein